ncbi:uncharacterized protein LOC125265833 [Megalobrama amblycephala]|uniref:uncharacterized protein LOC125265833 n=1 Tax=Megalobrama amblycephala TaxID=75352 RepID=UPI002013F7DD|nr:uncharacterized protein LOC125265833 [Megalobrama amblycephala]
MKNYSEISVFLLIICVFGADGDDVKIVSVQKGDSVTLNTGLRGQINLINWKFGDSDSLITNDERFRDRLELNYQTGSLTINNMRVTDSGLYHLFMDLHNYGLLFRTFIVTVHGVFDEDEVKTVSVMEGDSVTLETRLREKFNRIKWRFGDSGSVIAEIHSNEISYPFNDTERFRDRLKMNNQTGSLIIKNMRITDSGVYEIEIDHYYWNPYTVFNIVICEPFHPHPDLDLPPDAVTQTVFVVLLPVFAVVAAVSAVLCYRCKISKRERQNEEEKTESTKEGESVALKTDTEKQTDEEKLKLDHQTGSLKTTDSGDYKL